jgi:trans-aconitate methyltransferase
MHFDKVDQIYEKISITQGSAAEKLIAQLPKRIYRNILDIGCASGVNTGALLNLLEEGGRYLGIDISPKMIEQAEIKHPGLNYSAIDFELFNTKNQYDLLFCNSVFYYFKSPKEVLNKAAKLLEPGGTFAIQSQMSLCPEFSVAHEYVCANPLTKSQMKTFTFPANLIGSREYMSLLSQQDQFDLQSMICITDEHELSIDKALDVFKSGPAIPFLSDQAYSHPKPPGFDQHFLSVIRESLSKQSVNGEIQLHSPRIYIILTKV